MEGEVSAAGHLSGKQGVRKHSGSTPPPSSTRPMPTKRHEPGVTQLVLPCFPPSHLLGEKFRWLPGYAVFEGVATRTQARESNPLCHHHPCVPSYPAAFRWCLRSAVLGASSEPINDPRTISSV